MDWFYLWEAEAASWTAGCLCMTGPWTNLKTSPATWWRKDMLPNPEAKSSGSRCCLGSTAQEPCLKNTCQVTTLQPVPYIQSVYHTLMLVLTSLSLLSLCNWAPQNIYSSCNCSSYSTNDTPVFYHLVSEKTTLCLRYSTQDFATKWVTKPISAPCPPPVFSYFIILLLCFWL